MERPDYNIEGYSDAGYTIITNGVDGSHKDIYLALKNPGDYEASIPELLRPR